MLRSGVDVVAVTATVLDAEGRLATGLPREAFEVFEDGEPQTITQFTNERVPVGLGVLLDMSDSMFGRRIVDARAAVERFLFEPGYDALGSDGIVPALREADTATVKKVRGYERKFAARRAVLDEVARVHRERRAAEPAEAVPSYQPMSS